MNGQSEVGATSTTGAFNEALLAAYHAYEIGDDPNSAVNDALAEASEIQKVSVVSRLDRGGYVEGIFEDSLAGSYSFRKIDRLTERGIEEAQRLLGERTEFFASAHFHLSAEEQRQVEPIAEKLSKMLADPDLALSEEDENSLRDLSKMIDLILKLNEPDRLVTKRVLALIARKAADVAGSGSAWDALKRAAAALMEAL